MAQLTATPDTLPLNARVRDVVKPPAGQTVLVPVTPQEVLNFKFPISQVKIVLKDIDVYMIFPDGSQIVLPGLGIELSLDPAAHRLVFDTELVLTQDFFARIGPVETDDQYKAQVLQSVTGTGSVVEETPNDNISRVPPQPQGQQQAESASQSPIVLPPPVVTAQAGVPPVTIVEAPTSRSSTADTTFTSNNTNSDKGQIIKDLDIAIYTASQTSTSNDNGVNVIKHGFGPESGAPPASGEVGTGATARIFNETDNVEGSSGSDRIYPEDYPLLNVRGYTAAIARIAIKVDAAEGTSGVLRFTVPTSYLIVPQNGIRKIDARTYEMDATVVDGKLTTDIELGYKVPTGEVAPDGNGFYDRGSIAIRFTEDGGTGKGDFATQFLVGIRDVNNQGDLAFKTGTSQTVYVLPSAPSQNSISGGGGDDTIFGGGGKDTIDGGSGTDTLSYEWSGAAVSVALGENGSAAVVGSTGFARGDVIINIENLVGSDFADTLTGNSGNNSLSGGLGNDSLRGGGGADTLSGDAGANTLAGGTGDDVYLVKSADDRIVEAGGEGDDTVLVSGINSYTLSDNVERMTFAGTGRFTGIGSATDNIITGGSEANSLAGMGGADTLIGGAAADTLDGGSGPDSMAGGAGDDVYIVDNPADVIDETSPGSGGFDTVIIRASGMTDGNAALSVSYTLPGGVERLIYEGSADATLAGSADANTIVGGSGHNLLRGLGGSDSLVGGVQADTLEGGTGPGADSLAGGAGDDVYVIDDAATVILGEDAQTSIDTIRTTLSNYALGTAANVAVENLVFTGTGPFTGTGSDAANSIVGGSQANSLSGGAGDDTLVGSDVAGTLDGGSGNDSLVGGLGDDSYVVDSLGDTVSDTGGTDTVYIAPNSISGYTLNGPNSQGIENLTNLGSAAFTGIGSDVANVLIAGTGDNSMSGAGGNDSIVGLDGNDTLDGGTGDDTILGGRGANVLAGGDGNDSLVGGADSETMTGGAGADTLVSGGAGALASSESLSGGTGDDVYVLEGVNQNSHAVVIDDAGGIDTIRTNALAWDLRQDNNTTVENLTFTGAGASGTGNVLANVITGGNGNDTLQAITNTNGIGGDTLLGGDGNDSLMAAAGSGGDRLEGGAGADTLVGSDAASTLLGGADGDRLLGGTGNESLDGGGGADSIDAGAGNDTINDASGADSILGGAGSDRITVYATDTADGGADDDTFTLITANASIAGGTGTDEIVIGGPLDGTTQAFSLATATTGIEKLTVTGSTAFTLAGDAGVNTITGGSGDDSLSGGGGNDSLVGGLGNDTLSGAGGAVTLQGGTGNDLYRVDSSSDVILEGSGPQGGNDTISTSLLNYSMGNGNLNVEVLRYEGNATVAGGAGFTAQGDNGDQTIVGTKGNDLVDGGLGTDAVRIDYDIKDFNPNNIGASLGKYVVGNQTFDIYAFNAAFTDGGSLALTQNKTQVSFSSAGTGNDTLSGVEYIILNNAVLEVQLGVTNYGDQGPGNPFSTTTLGTIVTDDTMNGTTRPDNLFGGQGNDTYLLNNASDTVGEGRTVNGTVVDSGGIDTILLTGSAFTNAGGVAVFNMGPGNTQNFVPFIQGATTTTGVENLTLIGSMAASIAGNELANSITGGVGNDTLDGGNGNDTLDGGLGANSFSGGNGNDVFVVVGTTSSVSEGVGVSAGLADTLWVSADTTTNATYDLSTAQYLNVENITVRTAANSIAGGNYTLLGSSGANTLIGGSGTDSISGGQGDDMLVARGGNDTLDGGTGNDFYVVDADYSQPGRTLVINELGGTANGTADELRTTQNVFDMSDTRFGNSLANVEILRFVGADYNSPGLGNFTGSGSSGANTIIGGNGADSLVGGAANDSIIGGAGADTLDGATGDNTLGGTADTMDGGAGNDLYLVNAGGDFILNEQAGTGAGFIDTIQIVDSGLVSNVGTTAVSSYALGANSLNVENLVYNGSLAFTLTGNALDNSIQGGSGNDSISGGSTGGSGKDTLAGGLGDDIYFVDDNTDVVIENANAGTDTIRIGGNVTAWSLAATNGGNGNVENLISAQNVGASMQGSAGANSIIGAGGNDTLDGNGGADTLAGFTGDDYYIIDSIDDVITQETGGIDTVELRYATNPGVQLNLGSANTIQGSGILNLTGIENLVYAGPGAITVNGSGAANSIVGNTGDDRLNGGVGADTLRGGTGNDAYWIDNFSPNGGATPTGDVIIENLNEGADTVYAVQGGTAYLVDLNSNWYANVEALAFVNAGLATAPASSLFSYTGIGNAMDNTIVGANGPTSLVGGAGRDSLVGGLGNDTLDGITGDTLGAAGSADTLAGGLGNDLYLVNDPNDVVLDYAYNAPASLANGGIDTIQLTGVTGSTFSYSLNNALRAGVENLSVDPANTTTAFSLTGNSLNNVITGGGQNDTLVAGLGSDTLLGGAGNDVLSVAATPTYGQGIYGWGAQAFLKAAATTSSAVFDTVSPDPSGRAFSLSFTHFTSGLSHGSENDTIAFGGVTMTWTGATANNFTLTLLNGTTYTATVGRDGLTHVTTITYDGSGTPVLYLDGQAVAWTSSVTGTATSSTNSINLSLYNYVANATTVFDNLRFYKSALTAADVTSITQNPATGTTSQDGSLLALYDFTGANDVTTATNRAGSIFSNLVLDGTFRYGSISDITTNIYANTFGHSLDGGSGNDSMTGGASADTLDGGTGADTMVGGAGSDYYYVDSLSDRVTDSAGTADRIYVSNAVLNFTLRSGVVADNTIEILAVDTRTGFSSASDNFSLTGNSTLGTIIYGGAGADTILGGSGGDTIFASQTTNQLDGKVDSLNGGVGSDLYYIEFRGDGSVASLSDQVNDTGNGATDSDMVVIRTDAAGLGLKVNLGTTGISIPIHFNGTIENLDISTVTTGSTLYGNDRDNRITGGMGSDWIIGGDGNDVLADQTGSGGTGADTLDGGAGNDIFQIASRGTVILDSGGIDTLSIVSNLGGYTLPGETATLQIENIGRSAYAGAATFLGNGLANSITGSSSSDWLSGAGGNDTLSSYQGADSLDGGAGDDLLIATVYDYAAPGGAGIVDRFDGGTGTDTLSFQVNFGTTLANVNMTGSQLASMAKNIEIIDFKSSLVGVTLSNLTASDIKTITGATGVATLTVNTDNSTLNNKIQDYVTIANTEFTASGGGNTTNFYSDATKSTLIAQLVLNAS